MSIRKILPLLQGAGLLLALSTHAFALNPQPEPPNAAMPQLSQRFVNPGDPAFARTQLQHSWSRLPPSPCLKVAEDRCR